MILQFKSAGMPIVKPVPINTNEKSFLQFLWYWLWYTRKWEIQEKWIFFIGNKKYYIPKGFIFDGASIPKIFWSYLSPVGLLFIPAIIHDYLYSHGRLEGTTTLYLNRKESDNLFKDVSETINNTKLLALPAWLAVRMFGGLSYKVKTNA